MEKSYVNLPKAAVSLLITLFFGGYSGYFCYRALWPEAIVFLLLASLFLLITCRYLSVAVITRDGVELRLFSILRRRQDWSEIREVGIIGENVFLRSRQKGPGTLYVYFSPVELSEEERFQLAVKWPPKNMIYMNYLPERFEKIQYYWGKPVAKYNVGDLQL